MSETSAPLARPEPVASTAAVLSLRVAAKFVPVDARRVLAVASAALFTGMVLSAPAVLAASFVLFALSRVALARQSRVATPLLPYVQATVECFGTDVAVQLLRPVLAARRHRGVEPVPALLASFTATCLRGRAADCGAGHGFACRHRPLVVPARPAPGLSWPPGFAEAFAPDA